MVEPFSSILHQIQQNLAQNSHKFDIGIMETPDFEILTISCGMILRGKVVKIICACNLWKLYSRNYFYDNGRSRLENVQVWCDG